MAQSLKLVDKSLLDILKGEIGYEAGAIYIFCLCGERLRLPINDPNGWEFDVETITVKPSIRHLAGDGTNCHFFITNGERTNA